MANPEHLAILQDAIDKNDIIIWNSWRDQNPDIQPDLIGAQLNRVNLSEINLAGALLNSANLSFSNLSVSILIYTDLSFANLSFTNFNFAALQYANFEGAILNRTSISNADLSTTRNLDQTDIRGPSTIGIDTLYKSEAVISELWFMDFLEKCGVPETMRVFASSLVVKPIDYYSCFISYSSENEDFARLLYDTLRGQGIRVWFAAEQILPGHNIKQELIRGIQHWDKVILCCSKSSLTEKWWVDFERSVAQRKAQKLKSDYKQSIPVLIPLDLDGYVFDEYDKHPDYDPFLLDYHIADFTNWKIHDAFKQEVDRLIRALQTDDGREVPPESKH